MILLIIEPDTYGKLQEQAKGKLFKDPPIYRSGKMLIEVDDEVANAIHRVMKKHNFKTIDEAICYTIAKNIESKSKE
jgi:hypothetical protein